MTTTYTCQKCAAPASFVAGSLVTTCACVAPTTAHLHAVARGISSTASGAPAERASVPPKVEIKAKKV